MRAPPWGREGRLRPNERRWSPRWVVTLDTEGATRTLADGTEVDAFRLGVTSFDVREGAPRSRPRTEWATHRTPAELWSWVSERTSASHVTWAVAHGWHYDYALTAADRELPRLGWQLVDQSHRIGCRWYRWRRGRRSLVLVDLRNYLPAPLEEIGRSVGVGKRTMPRQAAPERTWERYCRRDAEIARDAFLRLLAWWDAEDLGDFGLTSASCALAAFRHRFLPARGIYKHVDPEARSLERRALYGGRAEVFRHGELDEGTWVELDYVSHYLATAWEVTVPVKLLEVRAEVVPDLLERLPAGFGLIAEVEVETAEPVVPFRHPRLGVLYPVGRFVTTLAHPELELVAERGRILAWRRVAVYKLAPALEQWAEWLWPRVLGPTAEGDRVVRRLLKDWTRSLIGKLAQRTEPTDEAAARGELPDRLEITVTLGHRVDGMPWLDGTPQDPERGEDAFNAVPAITAFIHSAARATLWRAMELAGRSDLAYADTDALLVRAHRSNLERLHVLDPEIDPRAQSVRSAIPEPATAPGRAAGRHQRLPGKAKLPGERIENPRPGRMAVKGIFGSVTVYRPKDYVLDGREVLKGVPRKREKTGERAYRFHIWPGVPWQRTHGRPGSYTRPVREVRLSDTYDRGWMTTDGRVLPIELHVWRGRTRVKAWARTSHARSGARLLDPVQAARVARADRAPPP